MEKRITIEDLVEYIEGISYYDPDTDTVPVIIGRFNNLEYDTHNNINDFPLKLKKFLDPFITNMYRQGSLKGKSYNISFLYALLNSIDDQFRKLDELKKNQYVIALNTKLINDLKIKFDEYDYERREWKKIDVVTSLKGYKNNKMMLQYVADYFNINIIIFHINNEKIMAVYTEENYNKYKQTILLSLFDDVFESLHYNGRYLFNINDDVIKKLIHVDKEFIYNMNNELISVKNDEYEKFKELNIEENNEDNCFDEESDVDNEDSINYIDKTETEIDTTNIVGGIFIKPDSPITPYIIHSKMKLEELQDIAVKMKVDINDGVLKNGKPKKKKKEQLYNNIMEALKN